MIELFPDARELNRTLRHFVHGQGGAAARVAVEFCQNDSGNLQRVIEMRRDADPLLASCGVDHEQDFPRLQKIFQRFEFRDQPLVNFLTTSRVEDVDVGSLSILPFEGRSCRALDIFLIRGRCENGNIDLFSECRELLNRGRSLQIAGDEHR